MIRFIFATLIISFSSGAFAEGEKDDCPQKLASISESVLSDTGERLINKIYKALGCDIVVEALPGRRALAAFNNASVDGELYRLKIVEDKYQQPFVRSDTPIFTITNSLWGHPNPSMVSKLPIGYVRGIFWQEKYMDGRRGRIFNSVEEVFKAFGNGEIGSFLSTDFSVSFYKEKHGFKVNPNRLEKINSAALYHYLRGQFAPFMKRFSVYISTHSIFSEVEIPVDGSFVN
ncbi:hypothetical protein WH95_17180 [Kiloniella litopenaei]|uniref:Solute-binding protein family 3/N-terminal domain-containing protein n=1 Tax=Kiloniella litopenaei TaxID=1549748 RepID=A0A0M2R6S0_9PROT|nr:hypothetical protein [Kiloniella litopenaei]KKJ75690.1 hypothetical protein WH95_17180 [Kiloniella litopenaei]